MYIFAMYVCIFLMCYMYVIVCVKTHTSSCKFLIVAWTVFVTKIYFQKRSNLQAKLQRWLHIHCVLVITLPGVVIITTAAFPLPKELE